MEFQRRSCEAQDGGTGVRITGTSNSPTRQNSKLFFAYYCLIPTTINDQQFAVGGVDMLLSR